MTRHLALWCNGSTSDSGSACEGSNPSKATKTLTIFSQASLFCAYDRRYAVECILVDNNVDDKHMHYSKCLSSALLLMMCFTQL